MGTTRVIDRKGIPFCHTPISRHDFVGAEFHCTACQLPRALHADREQPTIASNIDPATPPIRSPSFSMAMRGKLLDDRTINKYERDGYYSLEFQAARRKLWQSRKSKQDAKQKARGNFDTLDGRLIYRGIRSF